jgi:uncharacterized pyridoxal phosphate-dependent enzyme
MSPSTSTKGFCSVPTFASLGVVPVINCMGTFTRMSGSLVLPEVAEAMMEATNHYVDMDELMEKVGQRLAELTGAEFGYVASSCTAGFGQLTAACIAGADPEKMARLPDTTGMKNEVIIQKRHRNPYDVPLRIAGAIVREVVTLSDLYAAVNDQTAMVAVVGDLEGGSTIPVQRMFDVANNHGIPSIVDAGASRPDVPNRYLGMGASAVVYSGGKCLRGPQASGLVLGKKDLCWAAFLNGAPHHAIGRPMKVGKEEIMGLLAAVEAWVNGRDHQAEWSMWENTLATIRSAIADIPSVSTKIEQPGIANVTPTLLISWDEGLLKRTIQDVHQWLLNEQPRITALPTPHGVRIVPYMMEAGEEQIVASRLRETLLTHEPRPAPVALGPSTADWEGSWLVKIRYVRGKSTSSLCLKRQDDKLTGTYVTPYVTLDVEPETTGSQIRFGATLGLQSLRTRYVFEGTVDQDTISGNVNLGEFGTATWTATRIR